MSDDKVKPPGNDSDLEVTSVLDPDFDSAQLDSEEFDFKIDDLLGGEEVSPPVDNELAGDPDAQTLGDDLNMSDFDLDETMLMDEESPAVDDVEDDFDFELLEVIEAPANAEPAETEVSRHEEDLFKFDTGDTTLSKVEEAAAEIEEDDDLDLDDLLGDSLENLVEQPAAMPEIQADTDLNSEEDLAMPEAAPEIEPEGDIEAEETVIEPVETLDEPAEEAEDIFPEPLEEESPIQEEPPAMEPVPGPQPEFHAVLDQERIETIVRETIRETVTTILEKLLPAIIEDVV
ncbi:MAG: hypothetical protein JRD68_06760, partial [Deltaproteobacteria bacterium]|nr:hypothetical protein [Deltaproteobacteria bacterium]